MKKQIIRGLIALAAMFAFQIHSQTYDTNNVVVQNFAGSGFPGYFDGQGAQTMFNGPNRIVADTNGNLFVLDYANHRIRKITPSGTVSTYAGGGTSPPTGNIGTNVNLGTIFNAMAIDSSGSLWLTTGANLLRVQTNMSVQTISYSNGPTRYIGVCTDSSRNIYVSDSTNIYRLFQDTGVWEVFAGSGSTGFADGNWIFSSFNSPSVLAADLADNIYVYDYGNNLIRRIDQNKNVTTIAGSYQVAIDHDGIGTNATFYGISSMCPDDLGNIYLATFQISPSSCSIRKMTATTNVTTLAGSFSQKGNIDGVGSVARFNYSSSGGGLCFSKGSVFVADMGNNRIRQISFNPSPQVVPPANLQLGTYAGLNITGTVGRTYQIQTSPDMTTWSTKATLLLTSSPYLWIDQNPVAGNKYYRAVMLP